MHKKLLNDRWTVQPKANRFGESVGLFTAPAAVTLPHDALLDAPRSPQGGPATAYYSGGAWEYRRTLQPSELQGSIVYLEFEGIYRDALVFVNDNLVAQRPNGYVGFLTRIDHLLGDSQEAELRVEARTYRDSRWYSGAGIYRNVWLWQGSRFHVVPNSLEVFTPEVDTDVAVVTVNATVANYGTKLARAQMQVQIVDPDDRVVAREEAPATISPNGALVTRRRLALRDPTRWRPSDPYLYRCRVTVSVGDDLVDVEETQFGVRTLSLDSVRGLRINDERVLLRGACVHHDNGPLGAATIDRAEERRVELLKAAGFNAIRSAHNPMSKAMLRACDRLGVLVMDETFDMWTEPKSEFDYSLQFAEWWEADVTAMVRKDVNHPSVVLYSVGNEIPEAGRPYGNQVGRKLAEKVRQLDSSRFVTEAVSGILIGGDEMFDEVREQFRGTAQESAQSSGLNTAMTNLAEKMNDLMVAPAVARHSSEAFSYLDVAGYNYMQARYKMDAELYPHRVIVGTETHPDMIDKNWASVLEFPHVIGDFTWTGWDYLGEVGIGRVVYGEPGAGAPMPAFNGDYPWRAAWCGDIDLTGNRRPQSFYREIVFGLRSAPYVAVQPPEHHGKPMAGTPWSWSDVTPSWSWEGYEGAPVTLEAYAAADEVEILVNGQSLGRKPAGRDHRYRAEFEAVFESGVLEAVAWRGDEELGRCELRSAKGRPQLSVVPDRNEIAASPMDLAFVGVTLVDHEGTIDTAADRRIEVEVGGPGVLQALGTANPVTDESFLESACHTFMGRAVAVVRPTGPGPVSVAVRAHGCQPQHALIDVRS